MANIEDFSIPNLAKFQKFVSDLRFKQGKSRQRNYIFRGQGANWPLKTSLTRFIEQHNLSVNDEIALEKDIQKSFRFEYKKMHLESPIFRDEALILPFGQHHGLPTRLLDWSKSEYVALFFAFSDALLKDNVTDDVYIYILNVDHEVCIPAKGFTYIVPEIDGNNRLTNQKGVFTQLNTPDKTMESWINNHTNVIKPILRRISMPSRISKSVIKELINMGSGPSVVFPDAWGAALAAFCEHIAN